MSYCRWSSNSYRCDIYAYESARGFEVHVARYRHTLSDEIVAPKYDEPDYLAKWRHLTDMLEGSERKPIGLPHDGKSFVFDTESEMFDALRGLAAVGYNVPADLLNEPAHPSGGE